MELDLAALQAAEEPFVVVLPNGKRHVARPLSWPAYQRIEAAAAAMAAATGGQDPPDLGAFDVALRAVLRAAFPARWRYIVQPSADPVNHLMALGPGPRKQMIADFFAWAGAWQAPPPPATGTTPGRNGRAPSSAAPRP